MAEAVPRQAPADIHDLQARALYLRGLHFEWQGANEVRVAGLWQPSPLQSNQLEGNWLTAATALAEALKQDPSLHAAALHLARIRMLQGQRLEAATLFRSALASIDPSVAYLAALFLGSLEEREERFGEAESALSRRGEACSLRAVGAAGAGPAAEPQRAGSRGSKVLAARLSRGRRLVEPMWAYGPPDEIRRRKSISFDMEVWK